LEKWLSICKKLKLDPCLSPCTSINSKWIKALNIRPKTLKLVQQRTGNTPEVIGIGRYFLNRTPAAQQLRERMDKWECKLVQPLLKKISKLLKNLNIDLPYDSVIPLLGIFPKECNTGYSKGTCTPMFIAALFTISKLWKQPRCPTTDKWIKKMWCLYTMEFYSDIKKNEILPFTNKWIELVNIILSEISQAQKTKNCLFSPIYSL
jgi:hypothetical protein